VQLLRVTIYYCSTKLVTCGLVWQAAPATVHTCITLDACVLICVCLLHVFTVKATVAYMNATWALLQHAELHCASYMLYIGYASRYILPLQKVVLNCPV
jgi:hypothetical protein